MGDRWDIDIHVLLYFHCEFECGYVVVFILHVIYPKKVTFHPIPYKMIHEHNKCWFTSLKNKSEFLQNLAPTIWKMYRNSHTQTHPHSFEHTQTHRHTQTDRQTDRQTDTDTHTHTHTHTRTQTHLQTCFSFLRCLYKHLWYEFKGFLLSIFNLPFVLQVISMFHFLIINWHYLTMIYLDWAVVFICMCVNIFLLYNCN